VSLRALFEFIGVGTKIVKIAEIVNTMHTSLMHSFKMPLNQTIPFWLVVLDVCSRHLTANSTDCY
jgi:hypothetical protein